MAIRIITDSASDIAPSHPRVTVVPMTVTFGETEYRDGVDLDANGFYELLVEGDQVPTTSQISPGAFTQAFEEATADGSDVVCVTISSRLSGTYQSACLAAEGFDGRVFVVDSQNVTVGESVLVHRALQLVDEGLSAGEVAERLNTEKGDVRLVALLDTLEYLRRGGRVSAASAAVGGMLSIKPVVAVRDGAVEVIGKARGSKNGHNLLVKEIQRGNGIDVSRPLALGYTGLDDTLLRKYIEDAGWLWEDLVEELPVHQVGPTIGTHGGPGAIAVAFFSD
ncbi:DegV family protein [Caniella muris]|uniref:DegV family protein n=1 Tax=Caniella muris TaxID=2941502 RepID=UPI002040B5F8|nr:DegV family protein [Caniella muris]